MAVDHLCSAQEKAVTFPHGLWLVVTEANGQKALAWCQSESDAIDLAGAVYAAQGQYAKVTVTKVLAIYPER